MTPFHFSLVFPMTARMRSRITERAEKGLGSISFKRLLLAGGVAAFAAMLLTRMLGFLPGCAAAGLLLLLGALALTHPVEGLPLALYLVRSARSLAAVSSMQVVKVRFVTGKWP